MKKKEKNIYKSISYKNLDIIFSIWPFIVNAAVVVVVPVPKKELNTLQESEAKKNYYS